MMKQKKPVKEIKKVPCVVYSRICGYLSPIKYWNPGKKAEYRDRKFYRVV